MKSKMLSAQSDDDADNDGEDLDSNYCRHTKRTI